MRLNSKHACTLHLTSITLISLLFFWDQQNRLELSLPIIKELSVGTGSFKNIFIMFIINICNNV